MDAFRISPAHDNYERRLVDYSFLRQSVPIGCYETFVFEALRIALDGKNGDLRFHSLEDLVGDGFGSGERGSETYVKAMLSFYLCRKSWVDRFLERLFHD